MLGNAMFEQNFDGQEVRIFQKDRRSLIIYFRRWEQHEHVCEYTLYFLGHDKSGTLQEWSQILPFPTPNSWQCDIEDLSTKKWSLFPISEFGLAT